MQADWAEGRGGSNWQLAIGKNSKGEMCEQHELKAESQKPMVQLSSKEDPTGAFKYGNST